MKTFLIILLLFSALVFCQGLHSNAAPAAINELSEKQKALIVLKKKCNACHLKDKPTIVFALSNMNRYAKKIKKQVFIRKKMPKGNKHNLTAKEKQDLKTWVYKQTRKK